MVWGRHVRTHTHTHTQLWLYILATALFCRREQSLLCVAESFTYGAFQTLLWANEIPAGWGSFQRVLKNVSAIDSIPGWPLEICFLSLSLTLSLCPQLGMLKVEVGAWALHTHTLHQLHMCQTHPHWEQHSTLPFSSLYSVFCCLFLHIFFLSVSESCFK